MKSIATFRSLLAILICTFSLLSNSSVKAQGGIYWREGFNNSTGKLNSSSSGPGMGTAAAGGAVATYELGDAGTWVFYGAYRTTGTPCTNYGAGHIRYVKYTDGATTPWVVSPVVDKGISEIHFTAVDAGKRWIIQWTADTLATTSNWTTILDSVTITTSCVDTALIVNLPTAARVRFKDVIDVATGYQNDFDSVYFKSVLPLPVRFAAINANLVSNIVKINWTSEVEINTVSYSIERSIDGINFSPIGKIFAANDGNYSWIDQTPANGVNYYRIKSTDKDGSVNYSSVVKVIRQFKFGITVFPNPVTNQKLNLQLDGFELGQYAINIYNINGQLVSSTPVNMQNSSLSQTMTLPNIKPGIYQLEMTNGATRVTKTISVQ